MQVVPAVRTPHTLGQMKASIEQAFAAIGNVLTPMQCVNLTVLAAIETAAGRSMMNNNFGNISASPRYQGTVWRPPWFELTPESSPRMVSLHEAMLKGAAPSAFRAYASSVDGAADYARQIVKTFPEVLAAADQPDVDVFRRALGVKYSKDYLRNAAAVNKNLAGLQKQLGFVAAAAGGAAGGTIVAFVLFWLARKLLLNA